MLTDRFGGRSILSIVMLVSIIPAFLIVTVQDYHHLLMYGFFIGIALASFSVGVGFVSGWYSAEHQGFALGVYGAGNIGQSMAAFGAPAIVAAAGFRWGFWTFGVLLSIWWWYLRCWRAMLRVQRSQERRSSLPSCFWWPPRLYCSSGC